MKDKILHICERSTFLEEIIEKYEEVYPGKNIYLVNIDPKIPYNNKGNFDENLEAVKQAAYSSSEYKDFLDEAIEESFLAVFHNLGHKYKHEIAKRIKSEIPMHANLWGWEIYDDQKLRSAFLKLESLRFFNARINKSWKLRLKFWKDSLYGNKHIAAIARMSSISTVLKSDYDFLVEQYGITVPYVPHNYSKISNTFTEDWNEKLSANVLIGNSASYSNNHLDLLNDIDLSIVENSAKVYLPLSYGDDPVYKESVIKSYREFFGDKLVVLDQFLPP
ncbi:hypothetical protein ACFLRI_05470 [Bacteroidota bacterium]